MNLSLEIAKVMKIREKKTCRKIAVTIIYSFINLLKHRRKTGTCER